jgi:hypothetical protein
MTEKARYPNDPNRCQATTRHGQCIKLAVDNEIYCDYHLRDRDAEDKQSLRAYMLTDPVTAGAAGRHSQVEELKSLREEIALARAMIERRLNLVESDADFLQACGTVNTYLLTLERLISSCHKLEVNLGALLSKGAIISLAQEMVGILMDELEHIDGYEQIVDRVSNRMVELIAEQEKVD